MTPDPSLSPTNAPPSRPPWLSTPSTSPTAKTPSSPTTPKSAPPSTPYSSSSKIPLPTTPTSSPPRSAASAPCFLNGVREPCSRLSLISLPRRRGNGLLPHDSSHNPDHPNRGQYNRQHQPLMVWLIEIRNRTRISQHEHLPEQSHGLRVRLFLGAILRKYF